MIARLAGFACSALLVALACSSEQRAFDPPDAAAGQAGDGSVGGSTGGTPSPGGGSSTAGRSGSASGGGGSGGAGQSSDGGAGGQPPDDLPEQLACTEQQLIDAGSDLFTGTTVGAGDDFNSTCFSGNAADVAVEWIAPESNYYRFSTAGSSYDTALALLDDQCDGAELACNADASMPQVEVIQQVDGGQRVVVVVDGKLGATGAVALGIEPVSCPSVDVTAETLPVQLNTQNQGDASAACGGAGKNDRATRFEAPSDGLYRFTATSEAFGAIVSVEEGPVCGGSAIGCGYTARSGEPAEVVRHLDAGEVVTIFVDGGSGPVELDVEDISDDASCPADGPAILLDGFFPAIDGTFVGASHLLTGSCAPTGAFNPVAAYAPLVERSIPLSVDLGPNISCTVNVTSPSPFAAYLLSGNECGGPELECVVEAANGSHGFNFNSSKNGQYVLVIEDTGGHKGTFEIYAACVI